MLSHGMSFRMNPTSTFVLLPILLLAKVCFATYEEKPEEQLQVRIELDLREKNVAFQQGLSCLSVKVRSNCTSCSEDSTYISQTKDVWVDKNMLYANIDISKKLLTSGQDLAIMGVLNVDWCEFYGKYIQAKLGDFVSNESVVKAESLLSFSSVKINMTKYKFCGNDTCYTANGVCRFSHVTNRTITTCECRPYACGDVFDGSKQVCASDGQTYQTKCWMQASDCFSGTVTKIHDGPCHAKYFKYLGLVITSSAFLLTLFVVAVIFYIRYIRHQKKDTKIRDDVFKEDLWSDKSRMTIIVDQ